MYFYIFSYLIITLIEANDCTHAEFETWGDYNILRDLNFDQNCTTYRIQSTHSIFETQIIRLNVALPFSFTFQSTTVSINDNVNGFTRVAFSLTRAEDYMTYFSQNQTFLQTLLSNSVITHDIFRFDPTEDNGSANILLNHCDINYPKYELYHYDYLTNALTIFPKSSVTDLGGSTCTTIEVPLTLRGDYIGFTTVEDLHDLQIGVTHINSVEFQQSEPTLRHVVKYACFGSGVSLASKQVRFFEFDTDNSDLGVEVNIAFYSAGAKTHALSQFDEASCIGYLQDSLRNVTTIQGIEVRKYEATESTTTPNPTTGTYTTFTVVASMSSSNDFQQYKVEIAEIIIGTVFSNTTTTRHSDDSIGINLYYITFSILQQEFYEMEHVILASGSAIDNAVGRQHPMLAYRVNTIEAQLTTTTTTQVPAEEDSEEDWMTANAMYIFTAATLMALSAIFLAWRVWSSSGSKLPKEGIRGIRKGSSVEIARVHRSSSNVLEDLHSRTLSPKRPRSNVTPLPSRGSFISRTGSRSSVFADVTPAMSPRLSNRTPRSTSNDIHKRNSPRHLQRHSVASNGPIGYGIHGPSPKVLDQQGYRQQSGGGLTMQDMTSSRSAYVGTADELEWDTGGWENEYEMGIIE